MKNSSLLKEYREKYPCIIYIFLLKEIIYFISYFCTIALYDGYDGWFLSNLYHVTLICYLNKGKLSNH